MAQPVGIIAVFVAGHDLTGALAEEQEGRNAAHVHLHEDRSRLDQIAGESHGAGRSAQEQKTRPY